jgi:hypothetical protein
LDGSLGQISAQDQAVIEWPEVGGIVSIHFARHADRRVVADQRTLAAVEVLGGVPMVRTSSSILCRIFHSAGVCCASISTPMAQENRWKAAGPQVVVLRGLFQRASPRARVCSKAARSARPCGSPAAARQDGLPSSGWS